MFIGLSKVEGGLLGRSKNTRRLTLPLELFVGIFQYKQQFSNESLARLDPSTQQRAPI